MVRKNKIERQKKKEINEKLKKIAEQSNRLGYDIETTKNMMMVASAEEQAAKVVDYRNTLKWKEQQEASMNAYKELATMKEHPLYVAVILKSTYIYRKGINAFDVPSEIRTQFMSVKEHCEITQKEADIHDLCYKYALLPENYEDMSMEEYLLWFEQTFDYSLGEYKEPLM